MNPRLSNLPRPAPGTESVFDNGAGLPRNSKAGSEIRRRKFLGCLLPFAALLGSLLGASCAPAAEITSAREDQLKAAFLFNFTRFIDWPAAGFKTAASPIVIGVLAEPRFVVEIESAVKGRQVNGRGFVVRHLKNLENVRDVHLLFLGGEESSRFEGMKDLPKGAPILTVGESEAFARQGGIITLRLEGDKLRFDINLESADQAGLKMSSQLLKLARAVRRKP